MKVQITSLILFLIISFSSNLFCQEEYRKSDFYKEYNKLLDKYEREILHLNQLLVKSRNQANKLLNEKVTNKKQLENALRNWQYAELKIKNWEEDFTAISNKYNKLLGEKENEVVELKNIISNLKEKLNLEKEYRLQLESKLEEKDLKTILNDSYLQAKSSIVYDEDDKIWDKKFKPVLYSTIGFKILVRDNEKTTITSGDKEFIGGPSFRLIPGLIVSKHNNIFVGIGTGYEHYLEHKNSFSLIPIFISSMFAIDGEFVPFDTYNSDDVGNKFIYGVIDIGLSRSLSTGIEGGFFSNIGCGVMLDIGGNLEANGDVSWRRQKITKMEDTIFYNTLDLRIGLKMYLRKW